MSEPLDEYLRAAGIPVDEPRVIAERDGHRVVGEPRVGDWPIIQGHWHSPDRQRNQVWDDLYMSEPDTWGPMVRPNLAAVIEQLRVRQGEDEQTYRERLLAWMNDDVAS